MVGEITSKQIKYNLKLNGAYENDIKYTLDELLKDVDTFIDIGANEGYFSILGGKLVGKKGRVIAIETQTRLQSIINKNIQLKNFPILKSFNRLYLIKMEKRQ